MQRAQRSGLLASCPTDGPVVPASITLGMAALAGRDRCLAVAVFQDDFTDNAQCRKLLDAQGLDSCCLILAATQGD